MATSKRVRWFVTGLLLVAAQATAHAQYYPYYPGYGGYGPGNVLRGTASVIDATGNLYVQQEQARITREQANQAKLDTKRKTLDELNYERENTWTYTQEQERIEGMKIRRLLNKPLPTEITNGSAMNTLLPYLLKLSIQGVQGVPVYIDQNQLKQINVTGTTDGSSLGPLGKGKIFWPLGLRGPTQKQLDEQFNEAIKAARDGSLDPVQYKEIVNGLDKLQKEASARWNKEEIDSGMYLEAKRFLESLRSGITVLRQPDAAKYLGGGYEPRGNTVAELVTNMSQQGLRFAPAMTGGEPAYFGLYNSMVAFAAGGTNDSSFRVRLAPPPGGPPGAKQ